MISINKKTIFIAFVFISAFLNGCFESNKSTKMGECEYAYYIANNVVNLTWEQEELMTRCDSDGYHPDV